MFAGSTCYQILWVDKLTQQSHVEHAHGMAEGDLATVVRDEGFDYDSIFIPAGEKRTIAEVEAIRRSQSRRHDVL